MSAPITEDMAGSPISSWLKTTACRSTRNANVYPIAPHDLADTHEDKLNVDLLAFIKQISA